MISSVFQRNQVLFPLPGHGDCPKMLRKPITLRPFSYGEELSQRQNSEHLVSELVFPEHIATVAEFIQKLQIEIYLAPLNLSDRCLHNSNAGFQRLLKRTMYIVLHSIQQ